MIITERFLKTHNKPVPAGQFCWRFYSRGNPREYCEVNYLAKYRRFYATRVQNEGRIGLTSRAYSERDVEKIRKLLTKPVVDWRQVLRRFIDESNTRDFTWRRPNRRFLARRLITPSQVSESISHLVVAIDTSGSIDDKALVAFCSEVNGAFGDGMIDQVTVIYADAAVSRTEEFYAGDEVDMRPEGGGGTAFSDTFAWIAKNCPAASAIIYSTDLEVWDFGEKPAAPVMWAVYGPSTSFEQRAAAKPFGEAISLAEHWERAA